MNGNGNGNGGRAGGVRCGVGIGVCIIEIAIDRITPPMTICVRQNSTNHRPTNHRKSYIVSINLCPFLCFVFFHLNSFSLGIVVGCYTLLVTVCLKIVSISKNIFTFFFDIRINRFTLSNGLTICLFSCYL